MRYLDVDLLAETGCSKNTPYFFLGNASHCVPRFLCIYGHTNLDRKPSKLRVCWLGDTDTASRNPRHLHHAPKWMVR